MGLYKNRAIDTWKELKQAVEKRFSLTADQLLDAFYAMRQGRVETVAEYILYIEDKCLQLNADEAACYCHFIPLLDEEECMCLDAVCELTATLSGTMNYLLMWENLVSRARFGFQCSKLAPGPHPFAITGFRPQQVEEAAPGVAAVQVPIPCKIAVATSKERQNFATADLQVYSAKLKEKYPP